MTVESSQLQDLAERYTAAWCSQEPNRVADCYTADGSLIVNDSVPAVGRIAIAEVARSFMTAFPDMQVMMDELRALKDSVEYHWTLTGTNTGPEGTGNAVRISGFESWKMGDDGLIASSRGRFDDAEYQRQLRYVMT